MNKSIIFALSGLLLIPFMATDALAAVEFSENFDGTPTNQFFGPPLAIGTDGLDSIADCSNTAFDIDHPFTVPELPPSASNWGNIEVDADPTTASGPTSLKCNAPFSVPASGDYDLSAVLGAGDCFGCQIEAILYIDSVEKLRHTSDSITGGGGGDVTGPSTTFAPTPVTLTAGGHTVTIELFVLTGAIDGFFDAYFDDILIEGNFPVGSVSIPIDNTAFFVTSAPSMPIWLAPLVLSAVVAGMGLVLVRKN